LVEVCIVTVRNVTTRSAANDKFSTRVLVRIPLTSTQVLFNTGSILIQAANDKEGVLGQRTWTPKCQGFEQACKLLMKSQSSKFP